MADSQLHITVTTDDEGLRGLIAKLNSGNLTIKEYNKSLRDLRASSKIGSQGLLDLKEVQTQVADATAGSQGKMMRSYFKTGEELRRFYREQMVGNRTMREATQTVGVFGTMLGGEGLGKVVGTAIGGFQQMEFATNALGISAVAGGGKFASFGQTLLGMAGPLSAAAAGFVLLGLAIGESKKVTEELNAAVLEYRKSLVDLGKINKQQQVDDLTRRINVLAQTPDSGPGVLSRFLGPAKIQEEQLGKFFRREAEINKLKKERADLEKTITDEAKKQTDEADKQWDLEFKRMAEMAPFARMEFETPGTGIGAALGNVPGVVSGQKPVKGTVEGMKIGPPAEVGKKIRTEVDMTFKEMLTATGAFEDAFSSSMNTVGGMIGNTVGGAFANMFGGARTLLGGFVGAFTSALANMAAQVVASGILNLIFPGLGTVVTAAGSAMAGGGPVSSGRPYLVGERGPELFVPNRGGQIMSNAKSARFSGGRMGMEPIVLETRIRGNDLVLVQAKARNARNGRLQ